jgi:hypothetical protein
MQKNLLKEIESNFMSKKRILRNESKIILTIQKDISDFIKQYEKYFQIEISQVIIININ